MANNFIEQIIENDLESGKIKQIQTRFPPEPNGYLHIGHAKSLCINFGIKEKYKGRCFLRYDDTNPLKEGTEFVKGIEEDIKWLGFEWDGINFASDFFKEMFECATELIDKGLAYVCDLSAEEIRNTRGSLTQGGIDSPFRNRSVEQNKKLFLEMKEGKYADGQKVLRAKIDMASPNMNMRDPVIYRVLHAAHHNTGEEWCVYPMYDFAHPIEDALEGTTHSICTLEFEDHRPLYDWVIDNCGHSFYKSRPQQIEFARLSLTDTIMSKRFLKALVEEKKVMGWDDPRLPTLRGIRRKGYPAAAIKDFCERIGVAKANSVVDTQYLESCVREELNLTCDRIMAVTNPLKVVLTNYSGEESVEIENNPNASPLTARKVIFSNILYIDASDFALNPPPKYHRLKPEGYVRLKGAYVIRCDGYDLDEKGNPAVLYCSVVENSKSGSDGSGIKVKGVIQWVSVSNCVKAKLRTFDKLLNEGECDLLQRFNEKSMTESDIYIEESIKNAKIGNSFQFMRLFYAVVDKDSNDKGMVFNQIVSLKDNFNK